MKRATAPAAMLAAAALAVTLSAAPAEAKFAPPLGDWGSSAPPPGKLYNRNGITKIVVGLSNVGTTGYAPKVSWSARDAKGKPVTKGPCRIEVTFPGKRWGMYKSRKCQGSAAFPRRVYQPPGKFGITVLERVSGAFTTETFTLMDSY